MFYLLYDEGTAANRVNTDLIAYVSTSKRPDGNTSAKIVFAGGAELHTVFDDENLERFLHTLHPMRTRLEPPDLAQGTEPAPSASE